MVNNERGADSTDTGFKNGTGWDFLLKEESWLKE
jgi:hypothetical protein